MHRSGLIENSALVICRSRLAMLLDDVDSFDEHAAGLGIDAKHLSFLALVVAAHDANRVTLGDVHLHALCISRMARLRSLVSRLSILQHSHATKPPGRARRSSCTSSRVARAPLVRRCVSRGARP